MRRLRLATGAAVTALLIAQGLVAPLRADTMEAALVRAYQTNPQLNAQRASVRVTDENVPQALSGYRPQVSVAATAGTQYTAAVTNQPLAPGVIARIGQYGVNRAAYGAGHHHADAFQRPADRQQDPRGGEPGVRGT